MVWFSPPRLWKVLHPPCSLSVFDQTPLWPEYSPVRIVTRAGQHSGLETNPLRNWMPRSMRSLCRFGMYCSSSHRWSSVRMNTMFGRLGRSGEAAPARCVVPAMRAVATTANGSAVRHEARRR